ncbi:hypothetical protein JOM56_002507 [Amanita muscaria]
MLRSRAAISLGSISTRRGTNAHCRWHSSSSSAKQPAQKGVNRATEEVLLTKTLLQTSNSALIRTWSFPTSMRDALAIIRAVERKYGPVKEFKYFRDFEVPSNYQGIIKVAFRDPESQKRIPEEAEELRIILPSAVPDDQPGGVGLADLEEYLSSTRSPLSSPPKSDTASALNLGNVMANVIEENEAKAKSENAERVITCRIQRTNAPFYTPSYVTYFWPPRQEREAIARQLLNWGGFHDFPPIEKDTSLPENDFFGSPKLDHFRMRRCLRKASKYLRVPNPYEYSPEHVPGSVAHAEEVDWEPLSGSPVPQSDHDIMSVTLEEIQEMESAEWEQPSGSSSSQPKHDVLYTTSVQQRETLDKIAEVGRQLEELELHDNASSIVAVPPHSSDISLNSEPPSQPSTEPAASGEKSRSNELAEQLRAARSLARQVAEEQRRHTKPRQTSSGKAVNIQAEESLLEEPEGVPRQNEANAHPLRSETAEKRSESRQEEGNNMADRLKIAWKGLF